MPIDGSGVVGVNCVQGELMQGAAPLFSVVPDGLFGPLASSNREHYWLLLCRLFDEFFGPDAPLPPSLGFQRREITSAIERYLLTDDPWESEDGARISQTATTKQHDPFPPTWHDTNAKMARIWHGIHKSRAKKKGQPAVTR